MEGKQKEEDRAENGWTMVQEEWCNEEVYELKRKVLDKDAWKNVVVNASDAAILVMHSLFCSHVV